MIKAKVTGVRPMQRRLADAAVMVQNRSLAALKTEAAQVMKQALRLTPKEDGALRASAEIDAPHRVGNRLQVTLAFGRSGPASAYALAQHEHVSIFSPPSWSGKTQLVYTTRGTGTKYLERPVRDAAQGLDERVAARIRL